MKRINLRLHILLFFLIYICAAQAQVTNVDSLVIGEFEIEKIIDGDTFRLKGLKRSTRLLGIDTEETYKDRNAEEKTNYLMNDWPLAYEKAAGKSTQPVKIESPFGYKTWQWAQELFKDVAKVRLEKEDSQRFIDMYDRYLVYLIGIKNDGTEFNYNVEVVKNGFSPYYAKYGYSKRFHQQFVEAQKYAVENKLGIWSKTEKSYPDYEKRVSWWNRRGDALLNFEKKYKNKKGYFGIYEEDEYDRLSGYVGKKITVFTGISEILKNKDPYLIRSFIARDKILDLVVFPDFYELMPQLENFDGEYVYVRGKLKEYNGRYEIEIKDESQVWTE